MSKKIFIVDDEKAIVTLLTYNMEKAGYETNVAFDGNEAITMAMTYQYDLIILDLMLPGMDGLEVCKTLRQNKIDTPILILTAKTDEFDKILGLELGADDYITKPFSPREIVARVKAILRRARQPVPEKYTAIEIGDLTIYPDKYEATLKGQSLSFTRKECELLAYLIKHKRMNLLRLREIVPRRKKIIRRERQPVPKKYTPIEIGDLTIYPDKYEATLKGQSLSFTRKEFELLAYLTKHKGMVLSRDQLLNEIWDYDFAGDTRIVDVHISRLREKIEGNSKKPLYIKTVHGLGYKMEDDH